METTIYSVFGLVGMRLKVWRLYLGLPGVCMGSQAVSMCVDARFYGISSVGSTLTYLFAKPSN